MNGFKQQRVVRHARGSRRRGYAHIPLILGKNGKKLSKREAVTNILEYRDQGYLDDAVFNYITLLGWSYSGDQDVFTREEMLAKFADRRTSGKSGSKFDDEKLSWMAGDYVRRMPIADLVSYGRRWLEDVVPSDAFDGHAGLLQNTVACFQERIKVLSELPDKVAFVFAGEVEFDKDAEKRMAKQPDAPQWLAAYADVLEQRRSV